MSRQLKQRMGAAIICVVVALSCVGGVGYAAGWFGVSDTAQDSSAQAAQTDAANNHASGVDSADASSDSSGKARDSLPSSGEQAEDASQDASSTNGSSAPSASGDVLETAGGEHGDSSGASAAAPESSAQAETGGDYSASSSATPASTPSNSSAAEAGASTTPSQSAQPAQPTQQDGAQAQPSTIIVSVYIDSSRANAYNASWPSTLGGGTVTLNVGATVYDALCALGVSVGGSSYYVSSINGLAEKACGATSGWTYAVNGVFPNYACGRYVLSGGESIQWIYSTPDNPTISM